jgi:hypothetical protein
VGVKESERGGCHIICVPLRARSPAVVENSSESSESHVERGKRGGQRQNADVRKIENNLKYLDF